MKPGEHETPPEGTEPAESELKRAFDDALEALREAAAKAGVAARALGREVRTGAAGRRRAAAGTGLDANVAAALAYVGWALTGLLFYILEPEDRLVRFHALQSILLTAALVVTGVALLVVPFIGGPLFVLASIGFVIAWLVAMWKALQFEEFPLPFIGELARSQVERRT